MKINDIEKYIMTLRKSGIQFIENPEFPLSEKKRYRIEHGMDYHIDDLFQYLNEYTLLLSIQGEIFPDKKTLGVYLQQYRREMGLTALNIATITDLGLSQIYRIESGTKNYKKSSLEKYLSVLQNIEFELI